jgi:ATP-dependent protease HslVU (ClpYQ) peptidase subunit
MTCIIGYLDKDDRVFIGADSAGIDTGSSSLDISTKLESKIIQLSTSISPRKYIMLLGFEGSFAIGQTIRHIFKPPKDNEDYSIDTYNPISYLVREFIPALKKCIKENNVETDLATYIIAYQNHLYEIQSDYTVTEPISGVCATGCGYALATGALYHHKYMTEKYKKYPYDIPVDIIIAALNCAAIGSAGVSGPFLIMSLKDNIISIDKDEVMRDIHSYKLFG